MILYIVKYVFQVITECKMYQNCIKKQFTADKFPADNSTVDNGVMGEPALGPSHWYLLLKKIFRMLLGKQALTFVVDKN